MTWEIADLDDDDAILSVLNRDRGWAVYAICDLDPPQREHARYIGAWHDDLLEAVVLIFRPPDFTVMVPCGDPDGVRSVFATAGGLPQIVSLQVRPGDLPAIGRRYDAVDLDTMARLVLAAEFVRSGPRVPAIEIKRLTPGDANYLSALYDLLSGKRPPAATIPFIIDHGIYYGAFDGSHLAAVAGTHAISDRFGLATIGGVFTAPDYRNRGLAQATTGAVAHALAERGIAEIALNVRAGNTPAVAAYTRLGFGEHCRFLEGDASLRL